MNDVMNLIDPNKPNEIEVGGLTFYFRQLDNGEKLKYEEMVDKYSADEIGYSNLMEGIADLISGVEGYSLDGGILKAVPQEIANGEGEDPRPGDGLTVREFIRRIENWDHQQALFAAACKFSTLKASTAKN